VVPTILEANGWLLQQCSTMNWRCIREKVCVLVITPMRVSAAFCKLVMLPLYAHQPVQWMVVMLRDV
jgi:hypothetical protein